MDTNELFAFLNTTKNLPLLETIIQTAQERKSQVEREERARTPTRSKEPLKPLKRRTHETR